MSQVNIYSDRAAYSSDTERLSTKSAVSLIESDHEIIYDGVNVIVGKAAADIGDCVVYDKTVGAIRFVKGATLSAALLPASLVPLAVVYARHGDKVLIVSLENASTSIRWAHSYEVALSGFDLSAGGTIVLTLGTGSSAGNVSITYAAGATLADVAAAINAALKGGTLDYSTPNNGGWTATAADDFVVMCSNTNIGSSALIAIVSGCQLTKTPEDINYQTTLTGVLIEFSIEYIRRNNGINSTIVGCNFEKFYQSKSIRGTDASGVKPGSEIIIRESAFTEAANPDLVAAYPTYRDYIFGEHMIEYPSAYGAMNRDGKTNTAKIGGLRFVDIYGESAPCYPAAAAALDYGVTIEGKTTGLEAGAWWLPSIEEIYLLICDRVHSAADAERDPVNRTLLRLSKDPCYGTMYFWTACEGTSIRSFISDGSEGAISQAHKQNRLIARPVSAL